MPPANFPRLEGWLTATEVAERLHLSRQQINKMINKGQFSSTHVVGTHYLIRAEEVAVQEEKRATNPPETE